MLIRLQVEPRVPARAEIQLPRKKYQYRKKERDVDVFSPYKIDRKREKAFLHMGNRARVENEEGEERARASRDPGLGTWKEVVCTSSESSVVVRQALVYFIIRAIRELIVGSIIAWIFFFRTYDLHENERVLPIVDFWNR